MIDDSLKLVYNELSSSFRKLSTNEKREAIVDKIKEMANTLNMLCPVEDIVVNLNNVFLSEDEYLCYLNDIIYNFENKLGNLLISLTDSMK